MEALGGLRFDERGLVPAVVQDEGSGEVLMVAWMNEEAVRRTLASGRTWFWSRSRGRLWRKGDTSGHVQHVREVFYDCDADALLVRVHQVGAACHTGNRTCFFRRLGPDGTASAGNKANPRPGGGAAC
jgi:phosphoribosyl-AMP cyclohydrolase